MIPRSIPAWHTRSWQEELNSLITSPKELFALLELDPALLPAAEAAHALFPVRCTPTFAARMARGDITDPLLRQVLPLGYELENPPHFSDDPLQEEAATPRAGLIHKYRGRVLLLAASQCAINCRYCFRRHFDYQGHHLSREEWRQTLDYVCRDSSIREVILSGGDPLVMSDTQLHWLIDQLESIPHLVRLRVHSRLPIVAPNRITDTLAKRLAASRLQSVVVLHSNHAQEWDDQVDAACQCLRDNGVTLLNQSVLMRGINDQARLLAELSERMFCAGVLPYYLHVLDRVRGAAHFLVEDSRARSIYTELQTRLPGFLVPKLVRETPFAASKTLLI